MDTEKILELFKKYAGDKINLYGLIVTPVLVETSFKTKGQYNIFFNFENPNNVSYYTIIVENELSEDVESFESIINEKINTYLLPSIKRGLYFNNELKEKIQNVFDSVKIIKFVTGTPFIGYERYEIHVESVGFKTYAYDDESLYIENNVKALKATKNGEEINIQEAIFEYVDEFLPNVETYWETENLYNPIDYILNDYPLLTDRWGHIAGYYDTKFIQ
jgi:hypothetical protein